MDARVKPVDWRAVARELAPVPCELDPTVVKRKSRDFYWYSPILKPQLDGVTADLVAMPRNEAEVVRVAAYCAKHRIPLTPRGAGTGNYGQAMPLARGVILELTALDKIKWIKEGVVRVETGLKMIDLETETLRHGWELRFFPSTKRTATIGGFVCGGSGGVGSINFGALRDRGNVVGLRIVTLEERPRILELRGDEVQRAVHAYGTNGIVVEVELALARAWPWRETVAAFPDFSAALRFGHALATADAIIKNLITPVDWGAAQYFKQLLPYAGEGRAITIAMIAEPSWEAFEALMHEFGGKVAFARAPGEGPRVMPPLYEFTWNHTTLMALKVDPTVTYLQVLLGTDEVVARAEHLWRHFGDEVPMHVEFVRIGGKIGAFGLPLVRFSTPERLAEIIRYHDDYGCPVFNPHTYILEDGGMKQVDQAQLAFKREADPYGLLNPGKMRAWDESRRAA